MNIALLESSNTHSRNGKLFSATLYDYAESPRKTKKSDENSARVLIMALRNSYLSLSVGGNDFPETLFRVGLGGVK